MAFRITSSNVGVGWQPIANISATQNHPLGCIVTADDPTYGTGEFIYLKGVVSTVVGSWATYSLDDGQTTLSVANAVGPLGVAMAICTSGAYGWYQISGKALAMVASSCADNAALYLTATGGVVDDASVTGDKVLLALAAQANTATTAAACEVEISRPFSNDVTS